MTAGPKDTRASVNKSNVKQSNLALKHQINQDKSAPSEFAKFAVPQNNLIDKSQKIINSPEIFREDDEISAINGGKSSLKRQKLVDNLDSLNNSISMTLE